VLRVGSPQIARNATDRREEMMGKIGVKSVLTKYRAVAAVGVAAADTIVLSRLVWPGAIPVLAWLRWP
jgi:hypothetical protein